MFQIIDESQIDTDYLVAYYDTDLWHGDVQAIAAEGARNHGLLNIAPDDFFKTSLMMPQDIEEQRSIGRYFKQLNKLITLHQSKAFWREKADITAFTNSWEQRKLSDYLVTSTIKNYDGKYNREDVFSVSGDVGIVNQIEFQGRSFAGASVLNYGVVQNGDIVYTKSPLKSNPYGIIKANGGESGIVSTLYAVYHTKENTDPKFVECYFDSDWRLNNYLHPLVNKGAKNDMKVTADNALKGLVTFPASRKEQEKISGLISKLEEAITLHQRKLNRMGKHRNWRVLHGSF